LSRKTLATRTYHKFRSLSGVRAFEGRSLWSEWREDGNAGALAGWGGVAMDAQAGQRFTRQRQAGFTSCLAFASLNLVILIIL